MTEENRDKPYTVAEMIAELQKLPPDMRVMVSGYEGGYHDATAPAVRKLILNVHTEWYYGPHDNAEEGETAPSIEAALI